ncbi:MAG TPA: MBL fold metallo-hydrolase [Chitinophagaceae bacterium]|nr:MBL fold metallo-hydrolase [Chitinophagaceae bacterium]
MEIIPLSEGTFTIDRSKLFVPFDLQADDLQQRTTGSLLVEIQPFLVRLGEEVLLLDTGLGFERDGQLQLHGNLRRQGVEPGDVTRVLLTHLHKDHAGGVSREDRLTSRRELSFPNATYYIQERELEFALERGLPSFIPAELEMLHEASRVHWLRQDAGWIDGFIRYQLTGAHAPFHQVFWIQGEGQTIFFGGDDAPQLQQMKHRFVAKYDFDGKKAAQLRQQWWQQGEEEQWTFLFYHDVRNPLWSFRQTGPAAEK